MSCDPIPVPQEKGQLRNVRTHLRIRLVFNLEVGVWSFRTEARGQGGFANAAPRIILLVVRMKVLGGCGKRTLQVHWSWNTEGPMIGQGEG